ncbi:hypothetical protein AAE02nite_04180 [Adhaeribacter aerolatus]|uniref:DUF6970 domain-containing protein n=1 Tax=Adhaeribacter aerolatus TaxID=670289 RepID=A0A512ASR8_9BACT|nr:hypothetical protein [Adhaeribacter aerolatus]GEO02754.1 hypothetical protein AAE02nite_04180 [Adhaeribacter aerolatus]
MKRLLFLQVLIILIFTGCDRLGIEPGVSDCIVKSTKKLNKESPCDKGASVKEYKFQNKIVYVLSPGNCMSDSGAKVVDAECNQIGYLGGLTGNTKIDGIEFSTATFIRTIWDN